MAKKKASEAVIDVTPVAVSTIQMADPHAAVAAVTPLATHLAARAVLLKITTPADEQAATNLLIELAGTKKAFEDKMKTITKPLNEALTNTRALFKPVLEKLDAVDAELRKQLVSYRQLQFRFAEQKRLESAKLADDAQAKGDHKAALRHATEAVSVVTPARVVRASAEVSSAITNVTHAQIASRKRWTFEVLDPKKVPREYMALDEVRVRQAIRSGLRVIAGLRIFEEDGLAVGGR